MTNNSETIIFLHIPKTAGTTLNQVLQQQYPLGEIYFLGANAQASIAEYKMMDNAPKAAFRVVSGHTAYGFHEFVPDTATYFTLLRDPVERVVSFYHYVKNSEQHYLNRTVVDEFSGIGAFVSSGITKMVDNGQTRLLSGAWLEPDFGHMEIEHYEQARANLDRDFTVVGLTEEFDSSLLLLQQAFGWQHINYVSRNVGEVERRQRLLAPEEKVVLEQFNRYDIALYAYAQRLFERQVTQLGPDYPYLLSELQRKNRRHQLLKAPIARAIRRVRQVSVRAVLRKAFSE